MNNDDILRQFLERLSFTFDGKTFNFPFPEESAEERMRLRTSHRNERFIYKNKSAADSKPLLSIYSPDKPYKIYPLDYWFSDKWDSLDYGRDFDFNRPFFDQFHELSLAVPRANMVTMQNENSDYTTGTGFCKNCYLINSSEHCEDCYYGKLLQNSKNCVDSSYVYDSEILYQCFNVRKLYSCFYVYNSSNSNDCYFCDNVSNCRNCFLSVDLNGKEYYFMNEKCSSKEDYEQKIQEFFGSYSKIQKALEVFNDIRKKRIYKYAEIMNCENSVGDFIKNSKNCLNCYDVVDSEDCLNLQVGIKVKDIYDSSNMYVGPELSYQTLGVIETFNVHFSLYQFNSSDIFYSDSCYNSKNCFACISLNKKEYCIFNKQYSKEEYEKLVARIIEHMIKTGEWGKFFPSELSPFGYNETLANEYLPLEKEEATAKGYKWSDYEKPESEFDQVFKANQLPDTIDEVGDEILNSVIECERSSKNFKITAQELRFYRRNKLPLPHIHPDLRYNQRIQLRKPRRTWSRPCMKCSTLVESVFDTESKETVYCEKCYLAEVY